MGREGLGLSLVEWDWRRMVWIRYCGETMLSCGGVGCRMRMCGGEEVVSGCCGCGQTRKCECVFGVLWVGWDCGGRGQGRCEAGVVKVMVQCGKYVRCR